MPQRSGCASRGARTGASGIITPWELERRAGPRQVALLRMGLLHFGGVKEPCVVKNLSAGGLSARVYGSVRPDAPVEVELRPGERLAGKVVWSRGLEVGIGFAAPVDLHALVASRWVEESGRRPRMPRLDIECRARLRIGARVFGGTLVNISHGGAKVRTDRPVGKWGDAVLTLPDLPHVHAALRWAEGTFVGLEFNHPLPFEALAGWVRDRRAASSAPACAHLRFVRENDHG
ncbi:MAG: PilZ domain-containing protein [Alphaproteobacteria bacterium]|nr:PilZ domain-containing protein [Alphaproteobacteria bacterium]MBV9371494.1 PilZ domain-containing protein [Alphaproteobacteria bacterium]MBV9902764.1 PilZ domain-containing protein [Alphaproteobacteria bacterium]